MDVSSWFDLPPRASQIIEDADSLSDERECMSTGAKSKQEPPASPVFTRNNGRQIKGPHNVTPPTSPVFSARRAGEQRPAVSPPASPVFCNQIKRSSKKMLNNGESTGSPRRIEDTASSGDAASEVDDLDPTSKPSGSKELVTFDRDQTTFRSFNQNDDDDEEEEEITQPSQDIRDDSSQPSQEDCLSDQEEIESMKKRKASRRLKGDKRYKTTVDLEDELIQTSSQDEGKSEKETSPVFKKRKKNTTRSILRSLKQDEEEESLILYSYSGSNFSGTLTPVGLTGSLSSSFQSPIKQSIWTGREVESRYSPEKKKRRKPTKQGLLARLDAALRSEKSRMVMLEHELGAGASKAKLRLKVEKVTTVAGIVNILGTAGDGKLTRILVNNEFCYLPPKVGWTMIVRPPLNWLPNNPTDIRTLVGLLEFQMEDEAGQKVTRRRLLENALTHDGQRGGLPGQEKVVIANQADRPETEVAGNDRQDQTCLKKGGNERESLDERSDGGSHRRVSFDLDCQCSDDLDVAADFSVCMIDKDCSVVKRYKHASEANPHACGHEQPLASASSGGSGQNVTPRTHDLRPLAVIDIVRRFGGCSASPQTAGSPHSAPSLVLTIVGPFLHDLDLGRFGRYDEVGFVGRDLYGHLALVKLDTDISEDPKEWQDMVDGTWDHYFNRKVKIWGIYPQERQLAKPNSIYYSYTRTVPKRQKFVYTLRVFPTSRMELWDTGCSPGPRCKRLADLLFAETEISRLVDTEKEFYQTRENLECILICLDRKNRVMYVTDHSLTEKSCAYTAMPFHPDTRVPYHDDVMAASIYGLLVEGHWQAGQGDKNTQPQVSSIQLQVDDLSAFYTKDSVAVEEIINHVRNMLPLYEKGKQLAHLVRLVGKVEKVDTVDSFEFAVCSVCRFSELVEINNATGVHCDRCRQEVEPRFQMRLIVSVMETWVILHHQTAHNIMHDSVCGRKRPTDIINIHLDMICLVQNHSQLLQVA